MRVEAPLPVGPNGMRHGCLGAGSRRDNHGILQTGNSPGSAMKKIELTLACEAYDRTDALREGRIQPEGIDLVYLPLSPQETFWRMLRHLEFDAAEMSLSAWTVDRKSTRLNSSHLGISY